MLKRAAAVLALASVLSCASSADPPGGPPDEIAPVVLRSDPDSGVVLTAPPREAQIFFDEVVSENVSAQPPTVASAIILSPVTGEIRVGWHRDHLSVRPRSGFQPGRIYHIELLPVISDLRANKLRAGRTIVFSTGPEIPSAALAGTVVDWTGGKAAARALVEAMLLPDSLVYRALADSGGVFRLGALPPGSYHVRGGIDTNNDRRINGREIFDSVTVQLDSVAATELFAFVHDTLAPRVRQVEVVDSLTLRVQFNQPLEPAAVLNTATVTVALLEDSTTALLLEGVYSQRSLDSLLRKRAADSVAARQAADDSARAARGDSVRARPDSLRQDTARAQRPAPQAPGRQGRAPLDSTRAERMLARRPAPSDTRMVRMASPLVPDARYVIYVRDVRNLTGETGETRGQVRAPRPRATRARPPGAPADSTLRDSLPPADSLRVRPDTIPRDTTRLPSRP